MDDRPSSKRSFPEDYHILIGIPYYEGRARELYWTNAMFRTAVDMWADWAGTDVETVLRRERSRRLEMPATSLIGWNFDADLFRELSKGLPITLLNIAEHPGRQYPYRNDIRYVRDWD